MKQRFQDFLASENGRYLFKYPLLMVLVAAGSFLSGRMVASLEYFHHL